MSLMDALGLPNGDSTIAKPRTFTPGEKVRHEDRPGEIGTVAERAEGQNNPWVIPVIWGDQPPALEPEVYLSRVQQ